MHAVKGGWIGQTFALATGSDSGGRKARIRRSKEERKAMVESFIKRHQKLNNGNFPSLNLTHKEVGGSFYTVREIVREVIQENRILGPAKFSTEEHNAYSFLEHYPLGSISTEPQSHALSPDGYSATTNLQQSTTEDDGLKFGGNFREAEQQQHQVKVKDDQAIDGNPVALGEKQESDKSSITLPEPNEHIPVADNKHYVDEKLITDSLPTGALPIPQRKTSIESYTEELHGSRFARSSTEDIASGSCQQTLGDEEFQGKVQVETVVEEIPGSDKVGGAKEPEVLDGGMSQMTGDVAVEAFPLRPVSKNVHGLDEKSSEITDHLEEKKTGDERLNSLENCPVSRNEGQRIEKVMQMENEEIMDETAVLATHPESTNESQMTKSIIPEHGGITGQDKTSLPAETKAVIVPNGVSRENRNATSSGGSPKESILVETTSNQNTVQHDSGSKKGAGPTLNRINLETWEGRSRKSAGPETNPLLALFKSFVTALVKFLTE